MIAAAMIAAQLCTMTLSRIMPFATPWILTLTKQSVVASIAQSVKRAAAVETLFFILTRLLAMARVAAVQPT